MQAAWGRLAAQPAGCGVLPMLAQRLEAGASTRVGVVDCPRQPLAMLCAPFHNARHLPRDEERLKGSRQARPRRTSCPA